MRKLVLATLLTLFIPLTASAQAFVSPFVGTNFGTPVNTNSRVATGVEVGYKGEGILGGSLVFGYNPNFFTPDSKVVDLTGNLIVYLSNHSDASKKVSEKGIYPYVSGGFGLIHTQVSSGAPAQNQTAFDLGLGAGKDFTNHVGAKADLKYFRNIQGDQVGNFNVGTFHFWRASVGVTFR